MNHRFLFLRHLVIELDAFMRSPLELAWKSRSVDEAELARLRGQRPPAALPQLEHGPVEPLRRRDDDVPRALP